MNKPKAEEPANVVRAEISIEVIGEDEPTKYDRRRKFWRKCAGWSVVAVLISVAFCCVSPKIGISPLYGGIAVVISIVAFLISLAEAWYIDPKEPIGPTPWYYGAL
jgi:anti-sigma-K factor RskA